MLADSNCLHGLPDDASDDKVACGRLTTIALPKEFFLDLLVLTSNFLVALCHNHVVVWLHLLMLL